jgi:hypothetical protein
MCDAVFYSVEGDILKVTFCYSVQEVILNLAICLSVQGDKLNVAVCYSLQEIVLNLAVS